MTNICLHSSIKPWPILCAQTPLRRERRPLEAKTVVAKWDSSWEEEGGNHKRFPLHESQVGPTICVTSWLCACVSFEPGQDNDTF